MTGHMIYFRVVLSTIESILLVFQVLSVRYIFYTIAYCVSYMRMYIYVCINNRCINNIISVNKICVYIYTYRKNKGGTKIGLQFV